MRRPQCPRLPESTSSLQRCGSEELTLAWALAGQATAARRTVIAVCLLAVTSIDSRMRSTRDPPTRKQSEELTDDDAPVQDDSYTQMEAPHLDGPINLFEDDRLWGILRVLRTQTEHKLLHREKNGLKDHYVIGRSKGCDVVVLDKRVSSHHCSVYCDYSQATLRVFVEDNSSNGTFINGSWTKLNKKLRTELKSGDEIYLINPDLPAPVPDEAGPFLFINMRDRFAMQKKILHVSEADKGREINAVGRHIEDEYIIGEQLGSGMCGQVCRMLCR